MQRSLHFRVTVADPRAHLFQVELELSLAGAERVLFQLPSWIRGSYLVRDFAKHVVSMRAEQAGCEKAIEKVDKRSIAVEAEAGVLRLEYQVYAFDPSVRKAFLDAERGFFNGSSLFYCPQGRRRQEISVELVRPEDSALADWRVATTLPPQSIDDRGFGWYVASDYEALIDYPVEMGHFQQHDFEVDGIPHALVVAGRAQFDVSRVSKDLARICETQRRFFDGEPALTKYLFLTNVRASGYGGLEHRDSCVLTCSRGDLPRVGQSGPLREYGRFLGLCSHEYFHQWNVKRIRSAAFEASDLGAEAYSRDLWHYEGVTSYYDDLFLLRAGLIKPEDYLDVLAEHATRMSRAPGRLVQSLSDSSFETWSKFYQPDENSPNAVANYYVKGALAALCLDLKLRRDSQTSLDAVMQELWRRHGRDQRPVPEGGLEALAAEICGLDLKSFFDQLLRSTEELPLDELLADFGVQAQRRAQTSPIDDGGRTKAAASGAWVGLRLRPGTATVSHVLSHSPAERAGVCAGDQLLALDGLQIKTNNWHRRLEASQANVTVGLHLFRDEQMHELSITPADLPLDTWTLRLSQAEGDALRRRVAWLGA